MSIAENLNCDYSDISGLDNEVEAYENNEDYKHHENNFYDSDRPNLLTIKSMLKEVICNLLIFVLLAVLKLFGEMCSKPIITFVLFVVLLIALNTMS